MNYVKQALLFVQAHWVTFLALATVLWTVDKPYVTAYVAHHPLAAVLFANAAAIVTFYVKSPTANQ